MYWRKKKSEANRGLSREEKKRNVRITDCIGRKERKGRRGLTERGERECAGAHLIKRKGDCF